MWFFPVGRPFSGGLLGPFPSRFFFALESRPLVSGRAFPSVANPSCGPSHKVFFCFVDSATQSSGHSPSFSPGNSLAARLPEPLRFLPRRRYAYETSPSLQYCPPFFSREAPAPEISPPRVSHSRIFFLLVYPPRFDGLVLLFQLPRDVFNREESPFS